MDNRPKPTTARPTDQAAKKMLMTGSSRPGCAKFCRAPPGPPTRPLGRTRPARATYQAARPHQARQGHLPGRQAAPGPPGPPTRPPGRPGPSGPLTRPPGRPAAPPGAPLQPSPPPQAISAAARRHGVGAGAGHLAPIPEGWPVHPNTGPNLASRRAPGGSALPIIRTGFAWCYLRATRRGLKYHHNNPDA